MTPLCDWVWHCEGEVALVVRAMENHGSIRPGTFKTMERLQVPADYVELLRRLQNPDFKCTATRMKQVLRDILMRRSWQWVLMHPDLGLDRIHPSRSMSHFCALAVCVALNVCLFGMPSPCVNTQGLRKSL